MSATKMAPRRPIPVSIRLLFAVVAGVVLLAGIWVAGGLITNDFITSTAITAAWVAIFGIACVVVVFRRRELWPVLGVFLVTAAAAGIYLGTQTLIDREVHEDVATADAPPPEPPTGEDARPRPPANVLLGRGEFHSLEHGTSGVAQTIEVRGGKRVLTLTEFETSAGPDLRVYLSTADVSESSPGEDHVDLGELKGNVGEQQYDIPADVDLDRYTTVLIWCRAFSVGFGAAPLEGV